MLPEALLRSVADGRVVTRADLGQDLGVSQAELARQLDLLRATGVELEDAGDDSLRLALPIQWLELAAIEVLLAPATLERVSRVECLFEIESTNRYLLDGPAPDDGRCCIAIAEHQFGGRGRNGRQWKMPPGAGIALSASWRFADPPQDLSTFGLAVGAVARRAIAKFADVGIGLKWPNDLIAADRKLGGVLVELARLGDGATHVVAGIGLNVSLPVNYLGEVGNRHHAARNIADRNGSLPDRNRLAAALITQLVTLFTEFADTGFGPYREEWLAAHVLDGKIVELETAAGIDVGRVVGIGSDGALLVENDARATRRFVSADVSVRSSR